MKCCDQDKSITQKDQLQGLLPNKSQATLIGSAHAKSDP